MPYKLVRTEWPDYIVFGPVPASWTPSRGTVVSTHKTWEAAAAARKEQERKKK